MKRIILTMLAFATVGCMYAQVGVNTTDPKVSLDVQALTTDGTTAEGITAPRLTLAQLKSKDAKYLSDQTGTIVYVTDVSGGITPKTTKVTAIGYYYFDGTIWRSMGPDPNMRFFYMPPIVLPTDVADPAYNSTTQVFTVDLYTAYANQFGLAFLSTSAAKSPSASTLPVIASSALEYFITYYDNTVFQNVTLSATGVLTYKLPTVLPVSEKTFMNVVFKLK